MTYTDVIINKRFLNLLCVWINQPTNQPTNPATNQPTNQPTNQQQQQQQQQQVWGL